MGKLVIGGGIAYEKMGYWFNVDNVDVRRYEWYFG